MAAAAGFSVKAEVEVAVGLAPALPNKPLDGAVVPVVPNKFVLAGLAGGTPAGVVDGIENKGLAGVAVAAVLAVVGVRAWEPEAGVLAPKSEGLAVPNRFPPVGAGVGVVCAFAVLPALFPNKPPVDGVVDALLPNRPPADGAVLVVALPNKPPDVAGAPAAAPPKRPDVAGVVEDPPPNRLPPEVVGVAEAEEAAGPPKRPPAAGFCAAVLPWPPNSPPPGGLVAGVVDFPKEKLGVPEAAGAVPNRPPAAGAVLVVLLGAAPEVLGVPKLKAMAIGVVYLVLV